MNINILLPIVCILLSFTLNAQNTVIKAGHMFDAKSGEMLVNQTIIIKDGKIDKVGSHLKYNKTDTVIDLSNAYVLPGLMDCHVHITTNFAWRQINIQQLYTTESTALRALRGAKVAKQFLDNGFTTIKEIVNRKNIDSILNYLPVFDIPKTFDLPKTNYEDFLLAYI